MRNRFVRDISSAEILNVIAQRTAEDDYFEFKTEVLHPKKPSKVAEEDKEDLLVDLVAFANAAGGLILIGVAEDSQGKAQSLAPMTGDEARNLANTIRDLAIAHIRPGILQLEVVPFQMKDDGSEWIVVVRVPGGSDNISHTCPCTGIRLDLPYGSGTENEPWPTMRFNRVFWPTPSRPAWRKF